jgi:hypothetical protein
MNIDMIRENIAVLQDDIHHLESQISRIDPDSIEAESKNRIVNVKWRLLQEQHDLLERAQSSAAREGAEARWRWHEENDTIDLH